MSSPVAQIEGFEEVSAYYYARVDSLNLARGDTARGFRTKTGILRCVLVPEPEQGWTKEVADEHIELIKEQLAKRLSAPI